MSWVLDRWVRVDRLLEGRVRLAFGLLVRILDGGLRLDTVFLVARLFWGRSFFGVPACLGRLLVAGFLTVSGGAIGSGLPKEVRGEGCLGVVSGILDGARPADTVGVWKAPSRGARTGCEPEKDRWPVAKDKTNEKSKAATATAEPVEATQVTEVVESGSEPVTHGTVGLRLVRNGTEIETAQVLDWQNPDRSEPFKVSISEFALSDQEGLREETEDEGAQCVFFVGKAEIEANKKAFRLGNAIDKVAEVWTEEDAATMAKSPLPNRAVGNPKYPHVLRTEDGYPILLKSSKETVDGVTTGQDKVGVLLRCVDTGEVMRVWSSDLHQTCRTSAAKKAFDKKRAKRTKKAKPKKVQPDATE